MQAIQIKEFGPATVLELRDLPRPQPAAGQLRVRVCAAGVGPWDALIREGRSGLPQTLPLTLGSDIAGIVDAVGADAAGFSVGDEVYGLTNPQFTGGYAQYVLVAPATVAAKPKALSFTAAASVPVVAVTAWQMLYEYGRASAGQRVLIQGAAGNVGAYAVQMAAHSGFEVFATAGPRDLDYVRRLGARKVIDYRAARFEDAVSAVDIVLDLVGGDIRLRSIGVLKKGGVLVSVVSTPMPEEQAREAGVRTEFFFVDVTTARLNTVTQMFDRQKLVAAVGTVLDLKDARVAHQMLDGAAHARGKIVLNVADATIAA